MWSSTQPHEPKRVLDYHNLQTPQHVRRQALVKWKDHSEDDSTWENISVLRKRFPTFVFEEENSSMRREYCQDQGPRRTHLLELGSGRPRLVGFRGVTTAGDPRLRPITH